VSAALLSGFLALLYELDRHGLDPSVLRPCVDTRRGGATDRLSAARAQPIGCDRRRRHHDGGELRQVLGGGEQELDVGRREPQAVDPEVPGLAIAAGNGASSKATFIP
jgi:hypothetical protein